MTEPNTDEQYRCEQCEDTGYIGDQNAGIRGNDEYTRCECRTSKQNTDEQGSDALTYTRQQVADYMTGHLLSGDDSYTIEDIKMALGNANIGIDESHDGIDWYVRRKALNQPTASTGEDVREKISKILYSSLVGKYPIPIPSITELLTALFNEQDQWLPICDAPKDGAEILVGRTDDTSVWMVYWYDEKWKISDTNSSLTDEVTHFKYIKPPQKGK